MTGVGHMRGYGPVLAAVMLGLSCSWAGADDGAGGAAEGGGLAEGLGNDETFALFPIGKPWLNVRVPRYNDRDELISIMHTGVLTRQLDEILQLDDLTIALFQDEGRMSLRLKTTRGLYDLRSAKLRSRSKTFIEHQDFDMTGDRMEFDTKSQRGELTGNVEMVVYSMERAAMPVPRVPTPTIVSDPKESN